MGVDDVLVEDMKVLGMHGADLGLPEGKGWLLAEFGGDSVEGSDEKGPGVHEGAARREESARDDPL